MAVGEDVVGADGLTNRERFEMRREQKRKEAEARAAREAAAREAAIAAARARAEAAGSSDGMLSYEPTVAEVSGFKRYQELLDRGTIDEQGNILRPDGINVTEIMRGETPSWVSPELLKNAYIQAFESQSRSGQNFMDGGDYQNFLNAGYSLTDEQVNALGGVQGQGNQNDLTFGGGQTTTGVANPPPQNTTNPADAPMSDDTFETDRDTYTSSGNEFLEGYNTNQPEAPAPIDPTQPVATQNTPFADAYFKAMEAAKKKGPVSSMFADMLPGE